MDQSTEIKELAQALLNFHATLPEIKKTGVHDHLKKKYSTLADVLEGINQPLQQQGLIIVQTIGQNDTLTTMLLHSSGQYIIDTMLLHPDPEYYTEKDAQKQILYRAADPHTTAQNTGSAATYARRQAIAAMLGLNIESEDLPGAKPKENKPSTGINNLPWLNPGTKEWAAAKEHLKLNGGHIDDIKAKYRIGADKLTQLLQEVAKA